MNKKLLSIAVATLVIQGTAAEYIFKQKIEESITSNFTVEEPIPVALYDFTSHTFTNCSATGRIGPTLSACQSNYNTTWENDINLYNVSSGIQTWKVPEDGTYRITAAGAAGGQTIAYSRVPGYGRVVRADFTLTKDTILNLVVGQKGGNETRSGNGGGGGGGASWIYTGSIGGSGLLMVAGGGSGDGEDNSTNGIHGSTTTSASNCGGSLGNGGPSSGGGGGGAGWLSNGYTGTKGNTGGTRFMGGAADSAGNNVGGFGGGGGANNNESGGGAGYTGGCGSGNNGINMGGGGSYIKPDATNRNTNVGTQNGHGYITIQKI